MKRIMDLKSALINEAKNLGEYDYRFMSWAKNVTNVDPNGSNGYAFDGEFIPDGDVEIEIGNRLFLLMTTTGSRKYPVKHYRLVIMNTDGELVATEHSTTDAKPGWALRLRQPAIDILNSFRTQQPQPEAQPEDTVVENPLAAFSDEQIRAEFVRRGLTL